MFNALNLQSRSDELDELEQHPNFDHKPRTHYEIEEYLRQL